MPKKRADRLKRRAGKPRQKREQLDPKLGAPTWKMKAKV